MDLKRFFTETPIIGDKAYLTGKECYHAVKVIRVKPGYKLILCDGTPFDFYGTVVATSKDSVEVKIEKKVPNETEIEEEITLYIGANKDLDTVTQKAVEMGVKKIVPFTSAHCNVATVNTERMRSIVLESSKQCGRSTLAEFCDVITFDDLLKIDSKNVLAFYEYERNNRICEQTIEKNKPISLIIGCEGGFSVEEYEKMKKNNFRTLTLGKRILRVGTAVVAACALINERLGEI